MIYQPIDKYLSIFAHKNISVRDNNIFSVLTIMLICITAAQQGLTLNSVADSPNVDTVFYRLKTSISSMQSQFWNSSLLFLKQKRKKLNKCKCYISVDETYDSYSGKLHKKPISKLTKEQQTTRKYIHKYRIKRGDTGSFKYLVFALTYGNKRRVLYVKPLKRKESYWQFVAKKLKEIQDELSFECALLDRGFYVAELIQELEKNNTPYIIRAKITESKKFIFGFFRKWRKYDYNVANKAETTLILGRDKYNRKWAFATNIADWKNIRRYYKIRWDVENIFKATDGIQLKVGTANHKTRFFSVCLSFLIYNAWQNKNKRPTLWAFFKSIFEYITKKILISIPYRDKLKLNIPFWDLIIKGIE